VTLGWLLIEQAILAYPKLEAIAKAKGVALGDLAAMAKLGAEDDAARYYYGKLKTAQFYARRSLTLCKSKATMLKGGDTSALEVVL